MAYDELLADRIRTQFDRKDVNYEEQKMMGGLTFMVDDKMCIGLTQTDLMARIGPEKYDEALQLDGCREMNFTGRAMKGFVFIDPDYIDQENQLEYWIQLCLDYNPIAKSSKKRTKK